MRETAPLRVRVQLLQAVKASALASELSPNCPGYTTFRVLENLSNWDVQITGWLHEAASGSSGSSRSGMAHGPGLTSTGSRGAPHSQSREKGQQSDSTQLADLGEESAHLGEAMIPSRRQVGLVRSLRRLISKDSLMALHLTSCAEHWAFHNQWKASRINNLPRIYL